MREFCCALYRVVASVTRWLPGSTGQVSMPSWAGLTSPASMAAAAWSAMRSSMRAASLRPRNSPRGSGSTKGVGARSTWDSRRPQADRTAQSVRKRWPLSSSDPPRACLRNARANKPRMGTGARPLLERFGKRGATRGSMAATRIGQGKVAAHGRMGWASGTKAGTCQWGPGPPNQC